MEEEISGKRRFLVSFQDRCERDLTSDQITLIKSDRIPMTKEAEVPMISALTNKKVYLEKVYYHVVCVLLQINKWDCVDRK